MSHNKGINFVSLILYLVVGSGVYLSVKYIPIVWKKGELENLVKDHSYWARSTSVEALQEGISNSAERELKIVLKREDIQISKFPDRVKIRVIWRPAMNFFNQYQKTHYFVVEQETVFY